MTRKRTVAFCMAFVTMLFVIACIPVTSVTASVEPCSENSLPLSLAAPAGERMYFLPPYDEVASFTPLKKLYNLPVTYEVFEIRENLNYFVECEIHGQAGELCHIESITPRAP